MSSNVTPSEVETAIRSALDDYLEEPTSLGLTIDLAILARMFDALPVYADIGGALLIRPSGEVLSVHSDQAWDATASFELLTDQFWRRTAFEACASRYASLRAVAAQLQNEL